MSMHHSPAPLLERSFHDAVAVQSCANIAIHHSTTCQREFQQLLWVVEGIGLFSQGVEGIALTLAHENGCSKE